MISNNLTEENKEFRTQIDELVKLNLRLVDEKEYFEKSFQRERSKVKELLEKENDLFTMISKAHELVTIWVCKHSDITREYSRVWARLRELEKEQE